MNWVRNSRLTAAFLCLIIPFTTYATAQTPSPVIVVVVKGDNPSLVIIDPASMKIVGRVPVGQDPHEVVTTDDGKTAFVSNFGGDGGTLNIITAIDLVAQKALNPIDLGALRSTHGLAFAGGKLYFTAETNKAIGRYDPATGRIDWVMGTGQNRTHMVLVSPNSERIVTSNLASDTVSILDQVTLPPARGAAASAPPRKSWDVTNIPAGRGAEGFDISPDGKEIWTGNAEDGTVTIIDAVSKTVKETLPISVKNANRLKFTPDGKRVLISGLGAGRNSKDTSPNLILLDAATHKEIKQFNLGGGAAGILITPDGSRAFVAMIFANKLVSLDMNTLEVTGEVGDLPLPDGMAWVVQRASPPVAAANAQGPTIPADKPVVRLDPGLDSLVSADAKLEVVKRGFGFTEGPNWIQHGKTGYLLFADIPNNVINKITPEGELSVYLEHSGYNGPWNGFTMTTVGGGTGTNGPFIQLGADGMTVDHQGRIILCTFGDRSLVRVEKDGKRTVLADSYEGKRFNGPNDVVVKKDGAIYFTDTFSGLRNGGSAPNKGLDFQGVFRYKDGKLDLITKLPIANGLAFSPDEKYLYANGSGDNYIRRYVMNPDGTVGDSKVLIDLSGDKARGKTDGMRVDSQGNIYSTGPGGIWIISPEGKHLGTILVPENAENVTFGDPDWKTLYIAAFRTIYKIRVLTPGLPCNSCTK